MTASTPFDSAQGKPLTSASLSTGSTSAETITLEYPLENGLTSLTIRRPKVRDRLAADKKNVSQAEAEIYLFANLCEVTPETINELDMKDYLKLQEKFSSFLS